MKSQNPVILGVHYLRADPAACLVVDGRVVAMAEEERFLRDKHACGQFPSEAIKFCLAHAGLALRDVDYIALGWDVTAYPLRMAEHFLRMHHQWPHQDAKTLEWEIANLKKYDAVTYTKGLREQLCNSGFAESDIPEIVIRPHHYCHAVSAYLASGFREASIITMDGHGQDECTVLWRARGRSLEKEKVFKIPHSLGWFYAAITRFAGFEPYDGEGKCMGLAPYGRPNAEIREIVRKIVRTTDDGYEIDPTYFFYGTRTLVDEFSDKFANALGEYRKTEDDPIQPHHEEAAFEFQNRLEEVARFLASLLIDRTGIRNLCLAGGVAMNCKMNGAIHRLEEVEQIFIQPVSGDPGAALGAAMAIYLEKGLEIERFNMDHLYLGPNYSNEEIEKALVRAGVTYKRHERISEECAELLAGGNIVGWFQGRMEMGPRALGNRSILADPRDPSMKDKVNTLVKFREPWRPFCPSILAERAHEYLSKATYHPFMILTFDVVPERQRDIPSVVHVDGTTRPQTVTQSSNERYWRLIRHFDHLTGVPMVLNTSFNVRGEPIVCTPDDAIRCFKSTGMTYMGIGDFLVANT